MAVAELVVERPGDQPPRLSWTYPGDVPGGTIAGYHVEIRSPVSQWGGESSDTDGQWLRVTLLPQPASEYHDLGYIGGDRRYRDIEVDYNDAGSLPRTRTAGCGAACSTPWPFPPHSFPVPPFRTYDSV